MFNQKCKYDSVIVYVIYGKDFFILSLAYSIFSLC